MKKGALAAVAVLGPLLLLPVLLVFLLASQASGSDTGSESSSYGPSSGVSVNVGDSTFVDTGDNSWGGYSNGRIPESELCPIPFAPAQKARCDAADALAELNDAFRARFGYSIGVTDAYRTYAEQVRLKEEKGYLAATPGYSNHGWGLAFDLGTGINNYGSAQYAWMKANAGGYGIFHPTWAEPESSDYAKPEPWHWQFVVVEKSKGGTDGTPDGNRDLGQSMAADRGWTGGEWVCLEQLWTRESGWSHTADNPTSSAYGIPQALPGEKMAVAGADWRTNPAMQIAWGLDYIAQRYSTPCGAWAHSERVGWY